MYTYWDELERIIRVLRGHPKGMSVSELSRTLHKTRNSVAKYLDVLLVSGRVDIKRVGAAKLYYVTENVPFHALLSMEYPCLMALDENMKVQYCSECFLTLFGVDRDVVLAAQLSDIEAFRPLYQSVIPLLRKEGSEKIWIRNLSMRIGDNEHHFHVQLVPTVLERGKKGTALMLHDMTDSNRQNAQREKIHDIIKALMDVCPDVIIFFDRHQNIIDLNVPALESFQKTLENPGLQKEDLIGKGPDVYCVSGVSDMRQKDIVKAIETGEPVHHESRNENIQFEGYVVPLITGGDLWGVAYVGQNVSKYKTREYEMMDRQEELQKVVLERTQNLININEKLIQEIVLRRANEQQLLEERTILKELLHFTDDIVVFIDTQGKIAFINESGLRISGFKELEIIEENFINMFIPNRLKSSFEEKVEEIKAAKPEKIHDFCYPILTKFGKEKSVRWHVKRMYDPTQKIVGYLCLGRPD